VTQISKRHHFVSAFFLAGFTACDEKSGDLWVTDFETGKQFMRTPLTTGFQNDFHTVDVEGVEPDFVEKEILAKIEDRVAPTIKWVRENRAMPTGERYYDLMYFIALIMVKTPRARGIIDQGVDWLNKLGLKQVLKTKERWNALQIEMNQAGIDVTENVSYEEMKAFVDKDDFTFKVDREWTLSAMMSSTEAVMPSLVTRNWSVRHTSGGGLICSDHPTTCSFVGPAPAMWTPAPGLPNTEVQFPISRQVILIGSTDSPVVNGELRPKGVAYHNARTLRQADRFAYSTEKDFIWLGRGGNIKSRPDELIVTRHSNSVGAN
jgi:hypothetical protein